MRLHEFFNTPINSKSKTIDKHQADIKYDNQQPIVKKDKIQQIMNLFKTNPKTASHLLDYEAQKARQVIKNSKADLKNDIENKERERVIRLVQSISDISAYEESQIEVDRLVAQYMKNKSNNY